MTEKPRIDPNQIRARMEREGFNIFARLPPFYTASRSQSRGFLALAGGLSVVEWRTLWDLAEAGPLSIRDLASIQRTDHSLLSRALPNMRTKGYVTTHRDSGDGRQTLVSITKKGRAVYDKAAPIMARRRAALKEVFSEEEIHAFAGFMDKLEAFLHTPIDQILTARPEQAD